MQHHLINSDSLEKRCELGEFYLNDKDNPNAISTRENAIESLADLFSSNNSILVSDYINRNRLIFVDIEAEGFCHKVLDILESWVKSDPEGHSVRCLLYDGDKPIGTFLITRDSVFFEEVFKKYDWLRL